ncbi:MAG: hypothetical protein CBD97_01470 [Pelagibacteraceae bacterium TMED237]|nr:hypothetical protein [Candidatus Neomarinimicrobiota bacterium]OUW96297.1 MAG: hypothetical protein CBD97_01470 [Pelagibacteraceae bacterium TMED237]|tara:strand:- start:7293 stop:9341 length:2049 start_codon:yes stop_codon:yes gene_type:complete
MNKSIYKIFSIILISQVLFSNISRADTYRSNTLLFSIYKTFQPLVINQSINTNNPRINEVLKRYDAIKIKSWLKGATDDDFDGDIYLNRIYRITFDKKSKIDFESLISDLKSIPEIQIIERENLHKVFYTPNDEDYTSQWYLSAINSNDAWDYFENNPGNRNVILASVDSGVNWNHEDLSPNIYQNLGEDADGDGRTIEYINGEWVLDPGDLNGIDDDNWDNFQQTFIDDLIGWDVSGIEDNDPDPPHTSGWSHGTHVAGLLAATSNNGLGIASTAFNSSLLPVKCTGDNEDNNYITDGYAGVLYAAKMGYNSEGFVVINCSWGGLNDSFLEESVINTVYNNYNAVIVAAAGNGNDYYFGESYDYEAQYPCAYENVISVTAMGRNNSNQPRWGHWATYHETVDLSAPGESILSTIIGPSTWNENSRYDSWLGTSMASPVAASCAGLLKSYNPTWSNEQIKTMLIATSNPNIYSYNTESYLQGRLGKGQVDMLKAIQTPLFPKIEIVEQDIYAGSDGEINIGDAIEYIAILFNDPEWGDAINATLSLSSDDNCVSFENNYVSLGSIVSGDAGLNEIPIIIEFDTSCVPGNIEINAEIKSNQNGYIEYSTVIPFSLDVNDTPILIGDATNNGTIDVADVVVIINMILGNFSNPSPLQSAASDVNEDNTINIQDIILLVNIILSS